MKSTIVSGFFAALATEKTRLFPRLRPLLLQPRRKP